MNTLSLIKLFTLVGFLVLGHAALGAESSKEKTQEQCKADCAETDFTTLCDSEVKSNKVKNPTSLYDDVQCLEKKKNSCEAKCSSLESRKDLKAECRTAIKEYDEAIGGSNNACRAFESAYADGEKDFSKACAKKAVNCAAKMEGLYSKGTPESSGNDVQMMTDFALNMFRNQTGLDLSSKVAKSSDGVRCIKNEPDPKDQRAADEKRKKEVKKEADDQAELLKKQREKLDDIKEEELKIRNKAEEDRLKREETERQKVKDIRTATLESAKRIRMYGIVIQKEQQALAKENLAYQQAMLQFSKEKITMQCKSEFDQLKGSIIKAKMGDTDGMTPEQKQQLKNLAGQYSGVAGTADLNKLLLLTKKTCFEKADTQVANANLSHSQTIQSITTRIEEQKSYIADEAKMAAEQNTQIEEARKGLEGDAKVSNDKKLDELALLSNKILNFKKSTEEKIALSKQQSAKLLADIQSAKTKSDFNETAAYSEAQNMISKAETARSRAEESCCSDDESKPSSSCTKVKGKDINLDKTKRSATEPGTSK
ncbi:MAG: hypothetical protein H7061_00455 [Bdellovibrionaceae bacterium]|nr:hypothetical protein [Bdellovibrio sp.]